MPRNTEQQPSPEDDSEKLQNIVDSTEKGDYKPRENKEGVSEFYKKEQSENPLKIAELKKDLEEINEDKIAVGRSEVENGDKEKIQEKIKELEEKLNILKEELVLLREKHRDITGQLKMIGEALLAIPLLGTYKPEKWQWQKYNEKHSELFEKNAEVFRLQDEIRLLKQKL